MTIQLNAEQNAALRCIQKGHNLFLTGAGGTGKSHTIRAITEWARDAGLRFAVTAMTGCAALLLGLGAKTIHSWAGVGLAREAPHELAEVVKRNKRATRRWLDTQLLIIDEISMMTPEFLEKLDLVACRIRKRDSKFGGLQLVLAGDFCQLPPVTKGDTGTRFVFEHPVWNTLIDQTIELTQIKRQCDPVFQQILTEARMGALTPDSIKVLEERMGLPWQENEIRPTLLFSRNAEVDAINRQSMEALEGERRRFDVQTVVMEKGTRKAAPYEPATIASSHILVSPDDPEVRTALEKLDTDAPYEASLTLCVGAQVMLLTNMDTEAGLVNGSRGVLTGYTLGGLPIVKFLSCRESVIVDRVSWWLPDYEGIGRAQIPLKVAYAVTIHKSQGATLDSALVDIGSATFEFGQAYVALSRVRSLDGLYVWKLDVRKIRCHPTVVEFYKQLSGSAAAEATTATAEEPTAVEDDPTAPPLPPSPWSTADLSPAWSAIVEPYLASPAGIRLAPDPAAIKVVILGQDPYPTAGVPHGLAFSVRPSVTKLPPSLQNIYKELSSDLGVPPPQSGCLQSWVDQGVLLLNDVLTVTVGAPQSHSGLGWEELTARLLAETLTKADHVVLIAWGRFAQKKLTHALIKPLLSRHTVLEAAHPSPLSAHTGFFGSRPFSQANRALQEHGQQEIKW
jgi:ATP-dependent DNA helicase PIF1